MHDSSFWYDGAWVTYTDLRWALAEIPNLSTLDALCVELELITEKPALQVRSELLLLAQTGFRRSKDDFIYNLESITLADARWAAWGLFEYIRQSKLAQTYALDEIVEVCDDMKIMFVKQSDVRSKLEAYFTTFTPSRYAESMRDFLKFQLFRIFSMLSPQPVVVDQLTASEIFNSFAGLYGGRTGIDFIPTFFDALLTVPAQG